MATSTKLLGDAGEHHALSQFSFACKYAAKTQKLPTPAGIQPAQKPTYQPGRLTGIGGLKKPSRSQGYRLYEIHI